MKAVEKARLIEDRQRREALSASPSTIFTHIAGWTSVNECVDVLVVHLTDRRQRDALDQLRDITWNPDQIGQSQVYAENKNQGQPRHCRRKELGMRTSKHSRCQLRGIFQRVTFLASVSMIALLLQTCGCATAPKKFDFNPVAAIPGDFDAVWAAIVEYFAVANLPIATIEKDSGIIVSDWVDASRRPGGAEDKRLCDCGTAVLVIPMWTVCKFNVFAKRSVAGTVEVRVTCSYRQCRLLGESCWTVNCNSTGRLERQLQEYVRARVRGSAPPEVRVMKRPARADTD